MVSSITFNLPEAERTEIYALAKRDDLTVSQVLRKIVRDHLEFERNYQADR